MYYYISKLINFVVNQPNSNPVEIGSTQSTQVQTFLKKLKKHFYEISTQSLANWCQMRRLTMEKLILDILAAAQLAAETAERAAAAARSAASLAQVRISKLTKKNSAWVDSACDNPFHGDNPDQRAENAPVSMFDHQSSFDTRLHSQETRPFHEDAATSSSFDGSLKFAKGIIFSLPSMLKGS
ncbi:hypothetical protein SAY87_020950 [Trapa incisa]|uniref:Uncharacterized protein n=1 Tax=Trapa incisa TaxID=236973 RepID=A0AAN7JSB0_9MYRT|nr:hypothetical protein SAY87_020950 [Trapa incisa]